MNGVENYPDIMEIARPATPEDYCRWLFWWLEAGRVPTHFFENDMPTTWLVAEENCFIPDSFWGIGYPLIVPCHYIQLELEEGSRSGVEVFQDWELNFPPDKRWVPVYRDTCVEPFEQEIVDAREAQIEIINKDLEELLSKRTVPLGHFQGLNLEQAQHLAKKLRGKVAR